MESQEDAAASMTGAIEDAILGLLRGLCQTMTATPPCDVLVIAASNGQNLQLAERFASAAREQDLSAEVLDLTAIDLPLFTPRAQATGTPPPLSDLEARLAGAPRWVICAPEYNGSIPPVLTSAIAWLSVQGDDFRALFNARPVAIATHSGGGGHTVLSALRLQLAHLGAHVVGRQLVSNSTHPAKDDTISDLISRLHQLRVPMP
jgi:NAD(P)H-dependent FMN reductase